MNKKVLLLLLLITFLIMLSYEVLSTSVDEKQINGSITKNETNSGSMDQSTVIPLERPPFLEEEKT